MTENRAAYLDDLRELRLAALAKRMQLPPTLPGEALTELSERMAAFAMSLYRDSFDAEDNGQKNTSRAEMLESAAEILEHCSSLNGDTDLARAGEWMLRGSLMYTLANGSPSSQAMAQKSRLPDAGDILQPADPDGVSAYTASATVALLQRQMVSANRQAQQVLDRSRSYEAEIDSRLSSGDWGRVDLDYFLAQMYLAEGIKLATDFMLEGRRQERIRLADDALARAASILLGLQAPREYLRARLFREALAKILENSVWTRLASFRLVESQRNFLSQLTRGPNPIFELWESQLEALDQGLLDPQRNRIAISMPTSAGKTLTALLPIVHTLTTTRLKCIYVVPTRALLSEVETTLAEVIEPLGYKVASAVGALDLNEAEEVFVSEADVLVSTPEKLDMLIRRRSPVVADAGLVIFDEGQNLEDPNRGLRLELTAVKVKMAMEDAKIIMMSAVLPNAQEIADWLANGEGTSIEVKWQPTRMRSGVFVWEGLEGAVNYSDGQSISLFHKRTKTDPRFSALFRTTAQVAFAYGKRGAVLLLTTQKPRCEKLAQEIQRLVDEQREEKSENNEFANRLSAQIRREVSERFLLADLVQSGVAYHHADLPPRIRARVEEGVRRGYFKYVVSTTTLAEGVNLPLSAVVVDDLYFTQPSDVGPPRRRVMSPKRFWNIAGRAGRALRDTEGHVILIAPDDRWSQLDLTPYLEYDVAQLDPVQSVLARVFEIIMNLADKRGPELSFEDSDLLFEGEPILQEYQLALLNAINEGYLLPQDQESIRRFVNQTLFAFQTERDSRTYSRFIDYTSAHVQRVVQTELPDMDFRVAVDRSGLSIRSCLNLWSSLADRSLESFVNLFTLRSEDGNIREKSLLQIFDLALSARETAPYQSVDHPRALVDWIRGLSLDSLADEYFSVVRGKENPRAIESCSNYVYSSLSHYASWGLNAVVELVRYVTRGGYQHTAFAEDRGSANLADLIQLRELGFLPLYAHYGVDHPVMVFLSLLGFERTDARIVAAAFGASVSSDLFPDRQELVSWLLSMSSESLQRMFALAGRPYDDYMSGIVSRIGRPAR